MISKNVLKLTIILLIASAPVMGLAFAQEAGIIEVAEERDPIFDAIVYFSTFIVAAVYYSSSGYIKKVRRALSGEDVIIDYKKMGKTVLIGVIIGIGAYVYAVYDGEPVLILDAQGFLVQVGINSAAVLFIDKWILGRSDPTATTVKKKTDG